MLITILARLQKLLREIKLYITKKNRRLTVANKKTPLPFEQRLGHLLFLFQYWKTESLCTIRHARRYVSVKVELSRCANDLKSEFNLLSQNFKVLAHFWIPSCFWFSLPGAANTPPILFFSLPDLQQLDDVSTSFFFTTSICLHCPFLVFFEGSIL